MGIKFGYWPFICFIVLSFSIVKCTFPGVFSGFMEDHIALILLKCIQLKWLSLNIFFLNQSLHIILNWKYVNFYLIPRWNIEKIYRIHISHKMYQSNLDIHVFPLFCESSSIFFTQKVIKTFKILDGWLGLHMYDCENFFIESWWFMLKTLHV